MQYRREIDGLRAVAVLPVILFHAGFSLFSGGYVGVDVFFVISGYLITTIILDETRAGKFSIVNFYERRARRILPALALVILACMPFAWLWMQPAQLEDFARSVVAVSFFASNILFWQETGYFAASAELKPLLHTWSLAVEEQYYLLFPPAVALLWKFARPTLLPLLLLTGGASLALAHWAALHYPSAGFYLLPTRLWELLIGSLLAYHAVLHSPGAGGRWREAGGLLGLALIVYAILFFDSNTPFPSLWALVPTLGTALVIYCAREGTVAYHILGNRAFVGIGLVSYSAYLWHQPLFAFARIRSIHHPDAVLMAALGVLSLVLAYLSWRFVETPFRNKRRFDRRTIFRYALACTLVMISVGVIGYAGAGFPGRGTASGQTFAELDLEERTYVNFGLSGACDGQIRQDNACRTHEEPEILVWGDSFAMHLVRGVIASNPEARIVQMTKSACGPLLDLAPTNRKYSPSWSEGCLAFNREVADWIRANDTVRYAVLSSRFGMYVSDVEGYAHYVDGETAPVDAARAARHLRATLDFLLAEGIQPVLFSPLPADGSDLGQCLARAVIQDRDPTLCDFPQSEIDRPRAQALQFLDDIGRDYPVVRFDTVLCVQANCRTFIDDRFVFRDKGHLSLEGADYLGRTMDFYGLITRAQGPDQGFVGSGNRAGRRATLMRSE